MTVKIKLHIYPYLVVFSVGQTDEEFKKVLNGFPTSVQCTDLLDQMSLSSCNGCVFMLPCGNVIVRLKEFQTSPEYLGALNHEVIHATSYIMRRIGCKLSEDSEECYTYLAGYITKMFLKEVYKQQNG